MKRFDAKELLKNKYNHLLCGLILLFAISPSLEIRVESGGIPMIPLILMLVLVTALRADFPKGPSFGYFLIVAFVNFAMNLVIYFLPESHVTAIETLMSISLGIVASLLLVAFYFLSKRLFVVREVTADTIKGGVSAYLILGFAFAAIYGLLVKFYPDAFAFAAHKKMMFVHFSFTTLTTLGYGDIVPNGPYAAVLTNSEAIIGQLYLTIFVARLVGLYIVSEQESL